MPDLGLAGCFCGLAQDLAQDVRLGEALAADGQHRTASSGSGLVDDDRGLAGGRRRCGWRQAERKQRKYDHRPPPGSQPRCARMN